MDTINQSYIVEYLYENLKEKSDFLNALEKEALENHIPIISPEVGQFLRFLISLKKPKKILEIGTAVGYSSLFMLDSSKSIEKIVTIEHREDSAKIAMENFENAGETERIDLKIGEAEEILEQLDEKFDLIFIDAAKGQYAKFFEEAMRLLEDEGVIVCDNVLFKGMVASDDLIIRRKKTIVKRLRKFIKDVMNLEGFESSLIPMGDGLLVSVRGKI